ncbi:hypothetical protein Hrd1104_12145 [Halorhabdus sp. CBA1104]|uniref:hypothetical protein n=1 Tax=Halorhabdus sp. CBA1104 TaxID=1380432 RepID=UPI0012B36527|nr:hypothetical protein [Halorhabdus sp. CBA1104]QGN07971.1 hypothetical protein Hrd1104_12145 [Halorhabdus sp. CBA1104]
MDEKTEELRELFVDVAGTDTVTADQSADRGTLAALADLDDETVTKRVRAVVEAMAETFTFEADLTIEERVELVQLFYEGVDDDAIADALDTDAETVFLARLELHLFRASDTDASIEWDQLRERFRETDDDETLASELAIDSDTIVRYRRVFEARQQARRVSHRYRSTFRDVIPDAELADRLTKEATEDGLEEAAADIETDVSF